MLKYVGRTHLIDSMEAEKRGAPDPARALKTGCIPGTDFRYEELEGLLGSFYLTLSPLGKSASPEDREGFCRATEILDGIARQQEVQPVADAVRNPRAREEWARPLPFPSNWSTLDMFGSFAVDFGILEQHRAEISELRGIVLDVFERHGIAEANRSESVGRLASITLRGGREGTNTRPSRKCWR